MDNEIDGIQQNTVRIILADDHPMMRQALRDFLEKKEIFEIIAEASDGNEAVELADALQPDVIIMDIDMPRLDGLEATRRIKAQHPQIAILALTVYTDKEHAIEILEAGAAGYLTKSVFGEDVYQAILSVVTGEAVLTPSILQNIIKEVPHKENKPLMLDSGEKLSSREVEILKLAARGFGNKDIAHMLGISVGTVKSYMVDIFSKLGVGSRTEAVLIGLRTGILSL